MVYFQKGRCTMIFYYNLLSYIIYICVVANLTNVNMLTKKMIKYYVLGFAVLCGLVLISEPAMGIGMVIIMGVFLYINKASIFESTLTTVLAMLISVFGSMIYEIIFIDLLNLFKTTNIREHVFIYTLNTVLFGIFVILISIGIGSLIKNKNPIAKTVKNKKIQFMIMVLLVLLFTCLYSIIFIVEWDMTLRIVATVIYLTAFGVLISLIYMAYSTSLKEEEMHRKQFEYQQLEIYTQNLEIIYNDMRKIRHDYSNVLSSIVGYMVEEDMEGLVEYYDKYIVSFTSKMNDINHKLGLLSNIEQNELKGLIALKIIQAQELGIETDIDLKEHINFKNADMIDLCRILGILLDNALEETKKIKRKKPVIKICFVNRETSTIIVVMNNYEESLPPIHKIFEEGFSTKGDNRGLGLSNLKEIVDKNNNWSNDTIVDDEFFTQTIIMGDCIC